MVLQRPALEKFFGVSRFEAVRRKWIQDDVAPWFPFAVEFTWHPSKLSCFYLSRSPIGFPPGRMSDEARLAILEEQGVRGFLVSELPSEVDIVTLLSNVASGLSDLSELN